MGQQHPRKTYSRQHLQEFYTETASQTYYSTFKTYGYRKTHIQPASSHPLSLNHTSSHYKPQEKTIRKKHIIPSVYPYSCIGLLMISFKDKSTCGTGCLIGKRMVLTAASNLYDKETNQVSTEVKFVLNINGHEGDVYLIKKEMFYHEKFVQEAEGSHRYNYAVLEIDRRQISETENNDKIIEKGMVDMSCNPGLIYGYLGMHTKFTGQENIYIFGYSCQQHENNEFEYSLRGEKIDKLICKNSSLGYRMQSHPSECGSPILIRRNEYYHIVGIHITGKKELSSGLQFDQQMSNTLNIWLTETEGEIDLSSKDIDHSGIDLLTQYQWHNMTVINLDRNQIGTEGLALLGKVVWPSLRQLHLDENSVNKLDFEASAFKNVQNLHLAKNQLKEIQVLSQMTLLKVIDLSENKIESMQPLLSCKCLQRLNLSRNKVGKIPSDISKLSQMKKIYLSKNQINNIPHQILKLKELKVISLDGNCSKLKTYELIFKMEQQNVEVILD